MPLHVTRHATRRGREGDTDGDGEVKQVDTLVSPAEEEAVWATLSMCAYTALGNASTVE